MVYLEQISKSYFMREISKLSSMKIGRVWLGYANVLFLECGRLTKTNRANSNSKRLVGQIVFKLECGWRIEDKCTVVCGQHDASDLNRRLKTIAGKEIKSVSIAGRIPELEISLRSGYVIRTFQALAGDPGWSIGFRDIALARVRREWVENKASVWLGVKNHSLTRTYCFDSTTFKPETFLEKLCRVYRPVGL